MWLDPVCIKICYIITTRKTDSSIYYRDLPVITVIEEEVKANSPSRSAKLRVVRKIRDAGKERLYGVEAL